MQELRKKLELLYRKYNRRNFIHPDPLEFLYNYSTCHDREIVGLIASSLAYGKVEQILKSVEKVLSRLGASPYQFIIENSAADFEETFNGFKHRFTTGQDMVKLFCGIKSVIRQYGSLKHCFMDCYREEDVNYLPALSVFTEKLNFMFCKKQSYLLPSPLNGSACKRLLLYLRWMIRHDEVDPGCWSGLPASKLILPLDTHMYRTGFSLGFTKRKSADLKTAVQITESFASINKEDPAKYDFVLTRFGIRNDMDRAEHDQLRIQA